MKKKHLSEAIQGDEIKNEVQTKQANYCDHFQHRTDPKIYHSNCSTENTSKSFSYTYVNNQLSNTLQNPRQFFVLSKILPANFVLAYILSFRLLPANGCCTQQNHFQSLCLLQLSYSPIQQKKQPLEACPHCSVGVRIISQGYGDTLHVHILKYTQLQTQASLSVTKW